MSPAAELTAILGMLGGPRPTDLLARAGCASVVGYLRAVGYYAPRCTGRTARALLADGTRVQAPLPMSLASVLRARRQGPNTP